MDFVKRHVELSAAIVTIVAFVIDKVFNSLWGAVAALAVYSVAVTLLVYFVYRLFAHSMKCRFKDGYSRLSTIGVFKSEDGQNGSFEFVSCIQCKTAILSKVNHKFKWKGQNTPQIESLGKTYQAKTSTNKEEYDVVEIPIGKDLCYNECAVTTVAFKGSYSECCSVLIYKAEEPIGRVEFRVMLGFKSKSPDAILYRKKIASSVDCEFDEVKKVPFNSHFRMHEISFVPEVGYLYKLEWQK